MLRRLFSMLAVIIVILACDVSSLAPLPAPVIEPTPLPTFIIPTETPLPTMTPLPSATSTPNAPVAFPKELGANCRFGPGEEWEIISALPAGTIVEIAGRVSETTWWYVHDPLHPDQFCWVAASVVDTSGNLTIVPILRLPEAFVTDVNVEANVNFNACGGPNPITFNGSITTNGPATVTYHWEVGGDKQNITADETIPFTEAGTKTLTTDTFKVDCGNYFISLIVSSPNEKLARQDFSVQAP